MSVAKEGLAKRQAQSEQELGKLALERVKLTQRLEELDKTLFTLQVVIHANGLTLKELDADEAIEKAKAEAEAAKTMEA